MIRTVSFDVGWTLAYTHRSLWEIFADLCNEVGASTTALACEQIVRSIWGASQDQSEQRFRAGAEYPDSDDEFYTVFAGLGRFLFAQLGVRADDASLMQRFMERFWTEDNWSPFPDVVDALRALRAEGIRLGVLSNAPSDLPRFLDRFGLTPYLDFVVVSAIEGVKKPDRRIFQAVLRRAEARPDEVLHVGDMYVEDVVGGRAAGVHTLLMERGSRALFPNYRESEGRSLDASNLVSDLTQVLEHVRRFD
jgi:putative hydrolase of the HAD superfamily